MTVGSYKANIIYTNAESQLFYVIFSISSLSNLILYALYTLKKKILKNISFSSHNCNAFTPPPPLTPEQASRVSSWDRSFMLDTRLILDIYRHQ